MRNLENFTMSEVIGYLADEVAMDKDISKALAKKLVLNALTYNCVVDEILGQINFLMEEYDQETGYQASDCDYIKL